MDYKEISKELLDFIQQCPSVFHTVETISAYLNEAGFTYLPEYEPWCVQKGGAYYTTRNHSSIIAFKVGETLEDYHFQMTAAHGDSPTYKVKTEPELAGPGEYLKLNVEACGGMLDATWFDRPLGLAGRVLVRTENGVESRLIHSEKDLVLIPNLAIHMNREANSGFNYNRQVDLCPLFSTGELKKGTFDAMIAEMAGVTKANLLSRDLFLVNHQAPAIWGWADEFISSPKLDDLQCAFAGLKGFLAGNDPKAVDVYCCFDNEEVGSNTKQGAMSTFLKDTLERLNAALGKTPEELRCAIAGSFLVSCDNAHAVHPNHGEKSDVENRNYMNRGPVIKESANQKYTTDAFSRAVFMEVCGKAETPYQVFANRSDMMGGSTLGNISNVQVSVHAVDIGLPQLAMHSSYETAGVKDTGYTIQALTTFYNTNIHINGAEGFRLEEA